MNKAWYKSLTIISALVVMFCFGILIWRTPEPISVDCTAYELTEWAHNISNNQVSLIVMQIAMSSCVLVIVGRIRAKGGIGK